MLSRSARLAAALGTSLLTACGSANVAVAPAPTFSYAPGTSQYRLTSMVKSTQSMMGQSQDVEQSSDQLLTLVVQRAHPDTLTIVTTIDSVSIKGPMGMTPPGVDKLPGVRVRSAISPTGVVYSATGPSADSIPNADEIIYEMSHILPRLRPVLEPGTAWTDTVTRTMKQGGLDVKRSVIATYTVMGDSTVMGQTGLRISRSSATTVQGSGSQGGQPMTLDGTSTGKGTMVVTRGGVLLGYVNEENADIKVALAASGMEIGIVQNAVTKVEKVK